jgi:parallel beta-helix repeat protein
MSRHLVYLTCAGILLHTSLLFASEPVLVQRYVSATGNDKNSGQTAVESYRSIQHALQELTKLPDAETTRYEIVVESTVSLPETLKLTNQSLPRNAASLTIRGAGPGATLRGGHKITGWQRDGKLWRTKIPEVADGTWQFRELFVNGERRPRARTPNDGYNRIEKAGPDNRTSLNAKAGDLPNAWPIKGAEIVFFHDWCTSHIRLKSLDFVSGLIELENPIGYNAPHYAITHYEPHPRYYLENSPTFLDVPGEWYLNESTGDLTYYPLAKEFLDQSEFIAPRLTSLVEIQGTLQNKLSIPVTFENIRFEHCAWFPPEAGYAGMQAAFFENREPGQLKGRDVVRGAVQVSYTRKTTFKNCTFEHLGGSGLDLKQGSQDTLVVGCTFRDIAANGLSIGEAVAPRPNNNDKLPAHEVDPRVVSRIIVMQNLFDNCGALYYGAVGVWVGMANYITVEQNELRNLPYTGISVGWMWNPTPTITGNNRIEANHIHHIMQALSDGAGIYTLGRQPGTVLRGNWIHDVPVNAGRAESNGIFMDEGSTDMLVENNTIHNVAKSPIRFHKAGENTLKNNTLVVPPGTPPLRFNNTKPELIKVESANVIEHEGKWEPEKKLEAGPKK